jgi:hypothetical protein
MGNWMALTISPGYDSPPAGEALESDASEANNRVQTSGANHFRDI